MTAWGLLIEITFLIGGTYLVVCRVFAEGIKKGVDTEGEISPSGFYGVKYEIKNIFCLNSASGLSNGGLEIR